MPKVVAEAWRSARAQPVFSSLMAFVAGVMLVAIVLTNGRAVGAQREAIGRLDSVSARTITVRLDPSAGVTAGLLRNFEGMRGVEWAAAFGSVTDTHNGLIADGQRVGTRTIWTPAASAVSLDVTDLGLQVSPQALRAYGLESVAGYVSSDDGVQMSVDRELPSSELLSSLEPVALVYGGAGDVTDTVSLVLIIVRSAAYLAPVRAAAESFLPSGSPETVRIASSASAAGLQDQVGGQFAALGLGLMLVVVSTSGGLLSVIASGSILLRRGDFGRRRALGASRGWIVALIGCQSMLCCMGGTMVAMPAAVLLLRQGNDPAPRTEYILAVITVAMIVALVSSVIPGLLAASRDPIRELRVP